MKFGWFLPLWFTVFSLRLCVLLVIRGQVGIDARIYHRAADAWLAGGDPWAASVTIGTGTQFHFAGLPPTVLAFVPTALLPEPLTAGLWVVGSFMGAVYIVRRLRLAWWWLLFPPIVQGALSGNPGIVLLALLLFGHPLAETLAAALKVYAVVPMLARLRWAGLGAFGVACAASAVVFPQLWTDWLTGSAEVTGRLIAQANSGTGATHYWWLIAPTALALLYIAWRDRAAAGWLAVPALWPSGQFHYAVMALPVIRLVPAALFSMPTFGMPAAAVILHAWLMAREEHHGRVRPASPDPAHPAGDDAVVAGVRRVARRRLRSE